MHTWRKILALIIVMVFAPATIVAAMPLHLCFGADGHRAIESGFNAKHTNAKTADTHLDKAGASHFEAPADCVDFPLIKIGSQAHARADVKKADSQSSFGGSLHAVCIHADSSHHAMTGNVCSAWSHQRGVVPVDPFLAVLATTVLLH